MRKKLFFLLFVILIFAAFFIGTKYNLINQSNKTIAINKPASTNKNPNTLSNVTNSSSSNINPNTTSHINKSSSTGNTADTTNDINKSISSNTNTNKVLTKNDAASLILKNELLNQPLPKYCIPVQASNGEINNLKIVNDSNAFLFNYNNKLDNGILVGLIDFNQNNESNQFIIKDYAAIKNGGDGLIDKGTVSNTGEVKFDR